MKKINNYEAVAKLVTYDPSNGQFTSNKTGRTYKGVDSSGRRVIRIYLEEVKKAVEVKAHILAAHLMLDLPHADDEAKQFVVTHINGDILDNRLENLKLISYRDSRNTLKSGGGKYSKHKGISFYKGLGKWTAMAKIKKVKYYLGVFDTEMAALEARIAKESSL